MPVSFRACWGCGDWVEVDPAYPVDAAVYCARCVDLWDAIERAYDEDD